MYVVGVCSESLLIQGSVVRNSLDTIDRNMLLYKLMKYDITGNTYNLLKYMYTNFV